MLKEVLHTKEEKEQLNFKLSQGSGMSVIKLRKIIHSDKKASEYIGVLSSGKFFRPPNPTSGSFSFDRGGQLYQKFLGSFDWQTPKMKSSKEFDKYDPAG
jgi:hypothetical protein